MALRYPNTASEARLALTEVLGELTRRLPEILTFFLLIVLAMQLAYWTWIFFTPKAPSPPPGPTAAKIDGGAAKSVSSQLFGVAAVQETPPPVTLATSMRLSGVFASVGNLPAFAIISMDGQPSQPVRGGQAIAPGVVLEAVFPNYVLIRRNGKRERIDLDSREAAVSQPGIGLAVPAQAPLNVDVIGEREFRFSRAQLTAALQDPKTVGSMGRANAHPSGGVIVEEVPPGSLPDRLGLRPSDVVRQVNGQFIANPQELPRIYQQFSTGTVNEARLEVIRNGKPQQLIYHIQP